jgi:hypothetical protein
MIIEKELGNIDYWVINLLWFITLIYIIFMCNVNKEELYYENWQKFSIRNGR